MESNKVLIVGDKPSSRNTDPKKAFLGTPSLYNLKIWLDCLNLSLNDVRLVNSVTEEDLKVIREFKGKVIVLGKSAADRVEILGVPFFRLPHPSPMNAGLHNKQMLYEKLTACKAYLNEAA